HQEMFAPWLVLLRRERRAGSPSRVGGDLCPRSLAGTPGDDQHAGLVLDVKVFRTLVVRALSLLDEGQADFQGVAFQGVDALPELPPLALLDAEVDGLGPGGRVELVSHVRAEALQLVAAEHDFLRCGPWRRFAGEGEGGQLPGPL